MEEHSNTQRTPYLFTGKELDEETQLYYFGARYYDPRTSVWQSADPFLEKYLPYFDNGKVAPGVTGGVYVTNNLSLYSYGRNNPIVFRDPDGNLVPFIFAVIGAWIGCDFLVPNVANAPTREGDITPNPSGAEKAAGLVGGGSTGLLLGKTFVQNGAKAAVKEAVKETVEAATDIPKDVKVLKTPKETVSKIDDITKPSSKLPNIKTDVPKSEFEKNLLDNGFTKSTSKDGNVNIFTSGDKKYSTRDFSKSTDGPTAEVFKNNQPVSKIRLGDE